MSHILLKKRYQLEYCRDTRPSVSLGPHDLHIQTYYSGLNFADVMMYMGLYPDAPSYPFVPGYEFSGKVLAVGSQVVGFKEGDEVMGGRQFGAMAEEIRVAASHCLILPNSHTLAEGAGSLVSFLTAFIALEEMARLRPGEKCLVDCASGSLGVMLGHYARKFDLTMTGLTSSPYKKGLIEERGMLALTFEEWHQTTDQYDIIINTRGGKFLKDNYKRLAPMGRMIALGASSFFQGHRLNPITLLKGLFQTPRFGAIPLMNDNRIVGGLNVLHLFNNQELITRALDAFRLWAPKPVIDVIIPAAQGQKAYDRLLNKESAGKILLQWR